MPVVSSQPFSYTFLDEEFNKQYSADQHIGNIFLVFSILAILLPAWVCLVSSHSQQNSA